jgi:hypothetical protein
MTQTDEDREITEITVDRRERRKSRRYALSLPATVNATGQEPLNARSRDVSTRGVYLVFNSKEGLLPGTELDLTLTLPKEVTCDEDVLVRAHGKTVRMDTYGENGTRTIGVAIAFERQHFTRSGRAPS